MPVEPLEPEPMTALQNPDRDPRTRAPARCFASARGSGAGRVVRPGTPSGAVASTRHPATPSPAA